MEVTVIRRRLCSVYLEARSQNRPFAERIYLNNLTRKSIPAFGLNTYLQGNVIICEMSEVFDRIEIDPDICNGKPVIRGKRIAVQSVIEFLANGDSIDEVLEHYPNLEREDIYSALRFASSVMKSNYVLEPVGV